MGVRERVVTVTERTVAALRDRFDMLLPTVSLARIFPGSEMFEQVVGFGVLTVAFYVLAPKVYPNGLGVDEDRGLRVLFAAAGVAFSSAFIWARSSLLGWAMAFGTLFGTIVGFDTYLSRRKGWELFAVDGEAVALVNEFAPNDLREELAEDFARTGLRRSVAVGVWLGALGTFFAIPAFLAGLLSALIGTTFPFPDVLLLAVVSFDAVTGTEYGTEPFKMKNRLYSGVRAATSSLEGAVLVFLIAYGVLLSTQILATVPKLSMTIVRSRPPGAVDASTLWNAIGVVAVLVGVAAYDFWVWMRAIDRLPDVLAVRDEPTTDRPPVTSYPRGLTVPPTLALVAFVPFLSPTAIVTLQSVTFALVWPFLLIWLGICAYSSPSSPQTASVVEPWIIVAALFVQSLGRAVAVHRGHPFAAAIDPLLLFSFVTVPLIAYLPAVVRYATRHDDARRYATGYYLLYVGVVTAVVSMAVPGTFGFGVRLLSLVVAGGGLMLVVAEFLFP